MRIVRLLILSAFVFSATAATVVPVAEFRSIELSNGGHVIVRHGAVQRVSVVKGDLELTQVRTDNRGRLIIDRAEGDCPRGYRMQIEVVTPHLYAVSVSNGGTVQAVGAFPVQESIEAAVEQGGSIDIRSIAADDVEASVYSGGRIFITSRKSLAASVRSGGVITYWGDVDDVRKSVHDGGVVSLGTAEDAQKPFSRLGPDVIPPIPPLPVQPAQ